MSERLVSLLVERMHLTPPDRVAAVVHDVAQQVAGAAVDVYVIDVAQELLCPVPRPGGPRNALGVDATVGGRAFRTARPTTDADATRWVPVVDGVERLGVLSVSGAGDGWDAEEPWRHYAGLVAEHLVSKGLVGDALHRVSRRREMSLAAEMQWQLLPPLTAGTDRVTVSGAVEPSYEIGGDSFDYALSADRLQFGIFDAMGHGLTASVLCTVAVGAYRHARRAGLDLAATADAIDDVVAAQFPDMFVTAILAELDLTDGALLWLTAGHPAPLLVRDGRVVKSLTAAPRLPFGLGGRLPAKIGTESLQPADRLVLYTDGVVEARSAEGEEFGLRRLGDLIGREAAAGVPAPEMMRRLNKAVLSHQQGALQDDATHLLIEWLISATGARAEQ